MLKKLLSSFVALALVLLLIPTVGSMATVNLETEVSAVAEEEKILCTATVEDNFAEPEEQAPTSEEALRIGDADGNGTVNSADATRILLSVVGKVALTPAREAAADVNGDGNVAAIDATLILLHTVGKKLIEDKPSEKVTVPEPVYSEKLGYDVHAVYPFCFILVLMPEYAALNKPLTPEAFPDIEIESMGLEIGTSDRWYILLNTNSYEELVQAVDRIQDYDCVQTVELIPLVIDDLYYDAGWSTWYTSLYTLLYTTGPLSPADFFDTGVAATVLLNSEGSFEMYDKEYPYVYWAFLREDGLSMLREGILKDSGVRYCFFEGDMIFSPRA